MVNINIIYDGVYDDADIIAVPNEMVKDMLKIGQEFLNWIPPDDDEDGWAVINGKRCLAKGTVGFVKWLNTHYCIREAAYIVAQNIPYDPNWAQIDF